MNALEELRQRDQWVCWRTITRGGKPTKVPFQPGGREAASNDPSTWSSYEAVAAVADRFHGVGFMFDPGDEFAGIDIDGALVDGSLHPAVIEVVESLNSYAEWSPSGEGVHVLVRARKPDGSRSSTRKTPWGDEIAVYDRLRYFAITGDALPRSPHTIEERQAEVEALLERFMPPRNGAGPNGGARKRRKVEVDEEAVARVLAEHPGLGTIVERDGDDPSADDYALVCACARDGLGEALAEQLLAHRIVKRGDPKGKAARRDYIPNTVAKAYAEVARVRRDEQLGDPLNDASEIVGMTKIPIIAAEEQRGGRVVLERADGFLLQVPSLAALAKFDKLSAELAASFDHQLIIEKGKRASTAVRFVGALRRHFGPAAAARAAEDRLEVWMIELGRVAGEVEFTPGEERASAWTTIDEAEPDSATSAPKFAEAVVLARDRTTDDRYLRASWATEYLRRCGWRGSHEEIAGLLEALGLERPNADGRVKGGTLRWRFWVIPAELFGRWSA